MEDPPCKSVAILMSIPHHPILPCHNKPVSIACAVYISMCACVHISYAQNRTGTFDNCVHSWIPFTQYTPLATEALQSVVSCCLICLQEIALSDLVVPMDGDNLCIEYYS